MKPQALQDAIKGRALKKQEKGEWKDPYVKKYTITKEEYLREKQRGNPMAARSLEEPASSLPVDPVMLTQMRALLEQMQAEKYDWKKERDSLMNEMDQVRAQMKTRIPTPTSNADRNSTSAAEVSSLRTEVDGLKLELERLQKSHAKETEALRQELASVKINVSSTSSSSTSDNFSKSDIEALRRELQSLRSVAKEVDELKDEIAKLKARALTASTTRNGSTGGDIDDLKGELSQLKTKVVSSNDIIDDLRKEIAELKVAEAARPSTPSRTKATVELQNSPKTPLKSPLKRGKEKSTLPSCKPHSVQELSDRQRKDKVLKEYLLSKTGLPFSYKSMSIPDYKNDDGETKHLVCFDSRLYIPKKLRDATMEYYVQHHPYDSYTAMERHCIWPDCEEEMKEYKKNRS
jgi:predicted  nucleic acid-binding Zn-ribbon protein